MNEAINSSQIISKMATDSLDFSELENHIELNKSLMSQLNGARVLVYGGTGFIGRWLISFLQQAQIQLNLELETIVVSRNPDSAKSKFLPETLILDNNEAQKLSNISHIVFAATSATTSTHNEVIESFTLAKSVVELARRQRIKTNFIHLSSGASKKVKSFNPVKVVPRDYATLKKAIEDIVYLESSKGNISGANPRLYSFLGPLLPLESKYAAGNFMRAALLREPIKITGNPETVRTYLYPLELVSTLISLLLNPIMDSIEIGGTEQVSISRLAERINYLVGGAGVQYPEVFTAPHDYVPDQKMNLITNQSISLDESIIRWEKWFRS